MPVCMTGPLQTSIRQHGESKALLGVFSRRVIGRVPDVFGVVAAAIFDRVLSDGPFRVR